MSKTFLGIFAETNRSNAQTNTMIIIIIITIIMIIMIILLLLLLLLLLIILLFLAVVKRVVSNVHVFNPYQRNTTRAFYAN